MLYVREYVEYKPWVACRLLVVVGDNGKSQVEEYLHKLQISHSKEYRNIALVLKLAAELGPRCIHNERSCKIVGDVGEFKAKGTLLRVFWFFGGSILLGERRIDTIILTHAARPNKGQEQNREIQRAEDIAARYYESPFPSYNDAK